MAGIVTTAAILILLGTLLAYALVLRKRDKQNVAREIEILRKLVNESQSPDKLSGYKEIAWKCRIMCTKSQAAEIDALIADINTRQIEWMSLALDEELDGIIDSMRPKPEPQPQNFISEFVKHADKNPSLERTQSSYKKWKHKRPNHKK